MCLFALKLVISTQRGPRYLKNKYREAVPGSNKGTNAVRHDAIFRHAFHGTNNPDIYNRIYVA